MLTYEPGSHLTSFQSDATSSPLRARTPTQELFLGLARNGPNVPQRRPVRTAKPLICVPTLGCLYELVGSTNTRFAKSAQLSYGTSFVF